MTLLRERLAFRAIVMALALVPISAGLAGVLMGAGFPGFERAPATADIDSHFRYLSGLLLGIGLAFWTTVRRPVIIIDRFRLLAVIVIVGGCARLWSIGVVGCPSVPHLLAIVMELLVTPALLAWSLRTSRLR